MYQWIGRHWLTEIELGKFMMQFVDLHDKFHHRQLLLLLLLTWLISNLNLWEFSHCIVRFCRWEKGSLLRLFSMMIRRERKLIKIPLIVTWHGNKGACVEIAGKVVWTRIEIFATFKATRVDVTSYSNFLNLDDRRKAVSNKTRGVHKWSKRIRFNLQLFLSCLGSRTQKCET